MKPTRGGSRKGAGRKPGSGTGRTVKTSSINLPPVLWDKLDTLRGELTRSAWIAAKIKNARPVRPLYSLQRCGKDNSRYGQIHFAHREFETLCGLTADSNWWILTNRHDGDATCAKCIKMNGI